MREKLIKPLKFDNNKLRWDLLPIEEIEEVVKVLTAGSKKYNDNNWMMVVKENPNRYYAAALRHIISWRKGNKIDKESKNKTLAHAICCLLFLMYNDKDKIRKINV